MASCWPGLPARCLGPGGLLTAPWRRGDWPRAHQHQHQHQAPLATTASPCAGGSDEGRDRDGRRVLWAGPIPREALTISVARSSGPGGQNVNKVNTKADVRFNVDEAHWLPPEVRERLARQERTRMNRRGELVVASTVTRSQHKNIEDAIARIEAMCRTAATLPRETTAAKRTKIDKLEKRAKERRLEDKRRRKERKGSRRRDDW